MLDGRDPFGLKNPVESEDAVAYNTIALWKLRATGRLGIDNGKDV